MLFHLKLVLCIGLFGMALASAQAEPLSRAAAIERALVHNPEVAAARQVWSADRARALSEWALPDPELELEYEGMPGALDFGRFEERNIGISQRLEFPVKWWLRVRAARGAARASEFAVYRATELAVAARVRIAYDRVLTDERIVHYAREHLELVQAFFDRAKTRFEAGDAPQLDVMRAEVAVGRQENRLMAARSALDVSRARLNALLGQDPGALIEVADSLYYAPVDLSLDSLRTRALSMRPNLQGAQWAVSGAEAERSRLMVALIPDLSISVFRQTVAVPTGRQQLWRTGFALELPVWALLRQRGQIQVARAEARAAVAELSQARLVVLLEVEEAYRNLRATEQRVDVMAARILPTAEAAHRLARRSYDAGKATYLELLEAQRDLIETRTDYIETLFDYRSALGRLFRAVGQDLEIEEMQR